MFELTPSPMSQFHMRKILGFGLDSLPPFGTMSLNPVFFILKASLRIKSTVDAISLDELTKVSDKVLDGEAKQELVTASTAAEASVEGLS